MNYTPKKFELRTLSGLSEKQIDMHLKLYEGYVKHVNLIMSMMEAYGKTDDEGGKFALIELRRRLPFEFDGMRLHEYYFEQFEGAATALNQNSTLAKTATERYGEDGLVGHVKKVASARGIGWVIVYADTRADTLHTVFVNDHELGQLAGLPIILALDMWEHAYMVDYLPADKMNYIDAFFSNVNWGVVEKRFDATRAA